MYLSSVIWKKNRESSLSRLLTPLPIACNKYGLASKKIVQQPTRNGWVGFAQLNFDIIESLETFLFHKLLLSCRWWCYGICGITICFWVLCMGQLLEIIEAVQVCNTHYCSIGQIYNESGELK